MNYSQLFRPKSEVHSGLSTPTSDIASMTKPNRIDYLRSFRAIWATGLAALTMSILLSPPLAFADNSSQQVFQTPEAAGNALVTAAKDDDMNALGSILGPDGKQILSSGDAVADNNAREDFVRRYQQMHRFAYDDEGRVILYIGAENWPTPIPLIKKGGGWIFDTAVGKDELVYRRIGRNEIFTIEVLRDLVDAQQEYAASKSQFASKILSDPGQQNGLYWKTEEGQPDSPIGSLVADASIEGYKRSSSSTPLPFHGYYYRVLTKQGKNAPGGAKNYVSDDKMTKGFAFLAYPAEYRLSGVTTFMVNQDGIIVQKDLGPETAKIAHQLTEFNPNKTWDQVLEQVGEEGNHE
jgi:hypothetical protein